MSKRSIWSRLIDSTTKAIVWTCLAVLFYFLFRILRGWEAGLEGAPELFASTLASVDAIVAFYVWKSKNENLLRWSKPYGLGRRAMEQIAKIESEE